MANYLQGLPHVNKHIKLHQSSLCSEIVNLTEGRSHCTVKTMTRRYLTVNKQGLGYRPMVSPRRMFITNCYFEIALNLEIKGSAGNSKKTKATVVL